MAPQEGIDIPECLKDSRAEFLAAAEGLSEEQAKATPVPGRWSVVECVEHVVAAETRFLGWLRSPIAEPAAPANKEKEAMILSRVAARATAVGRFATLAEALAEFEAIRAQSIQLLKAMDLYCIRWPPSDNEGIAGLWSFFTVTLSITGSWSRRRWYWPLSIKSSLCSIR